MSQREPWKSVPIWDRYKSCTIYTIDGDVHKLHFTMDYVDHEMIASVMLTYDIEKADIIGIEITKHKHKFKQ